MQELNKIKVRMKDVSPLTQHIDSQLCHFSLSDSALSDRWAAVQEQNKIKVRKKDDSLPGKYQQLGIIQHCLGKYLPTRRLCTDVSRKKPVMPVQEKRKTKAREKFKTYHLNELSPSVDLPGNEYCVYVSAKCIPDFARNDSLTICEMKSNICLQEQSRIKVKNKKNSSYDEHFNSFCHRTVKERVRSDIGCSSASLTDNMDQKNVNSQWTARLNIFCMVNESDHLTERRQQEIVQSNLSISAIVQLGLVFLLITRWCMCLPCSSSESNDAEFETSCDHNFHPLLGNLIQSSISGEFHSGGTHKALDTVSRIAQLNPASQSDEKQWLSVLQTPVETLQGISSDDYSIQSMNSEPDGEGSTNTMLTEQQSCCKTLEAHQKNSITNVYISEEQNHMALQPVQANLVTLNPFDASQIRLLNFSNVSPSKLVLPCSSLGASNSLTKSNTNINHNVSQHSLALGTVHHLVTNSQEWSGIKNTPTDPTTSTAIGQSESLVYTWTGHDVSTKLNTISSKACGNKNSQAHFLKNYIKQFQTTDVMPQKRSLQLTWEIPITLEVCVISEPLSLGVLLYTDEYKSQLVHTSSIIVPTSLSTLQKDFIVVHYSCNRRTMPAAPMPQSAKSLFEIANAVTNLVMSIYHLLYTWYPYLRRQIAKDQQHFNVSTAYHILNVTEERLRSVTSHHFYNSIPREVKGLSVSLKLHRCDIPCVQLGELCRAQVYRCIEVQLSGHNPTIMHQPTQRKLTYQGSVMCSSIVEDMLPTSVHDSDDKKETVTGTGRKKSDTYDGGGSNHPRDREDEDINQSSDKNDSEGGSGYSGDEEDSYNEEDRRGDKVKNSSKRQIRQKRAKIEQQLSCSYCMHFDHLISINRGLDDDDQPSQQENNCPSQQETNHQPSYAIHVVQGASAHLRIQPPIQQCHEQAYQLQVTPHSILQLILQYCRTVILIQSNQQTETSPLLQILPNQGIPIEETFHQLVSATAQGSLLVQPQAVQEPYTFSSGIMDRILSLIIGSTVTTPSSLATCTDSGLGANISTTPCQLLLARNDQCQAIHGDTAMLIPSHQKQPQCCLSINWNCAEPNVGGPLNVNNVMHVS